MFSLPIGSGCAQEARALLQQLEWGRKSQYAASEQRLGITKELWANQDTPTGLHFVVCFQSRTSEIRLDGFGLWFTQQA